MIKAIMPAQPRQRAVSAKLELQAPPPSPAPIRTARRPENSAPAQPVQQTRTVMVMTEWTEMHASSQVTYTTAKDRFVRRPSVEPALYLVRTPNGWLIIQI